MDNKHEKQPLLNVLARVRRTINQVYTQHKNTTLLSTAFGQLEDVQTILDIHETPEHRTINDIVSTIKKKVVSVYTGETGPSYLASAVHQLDAQIMGLMYGDPKERTYANSVSVR